MGLRETCEAAALAERTNQSGLVVGLKGYCNDLRVIAVDALANAMPVEIVKTRTESAVCSKFHAYETGGTADLGHKIYTDISVRYHIYALVYS